jgi:hypothetical protein
MDGICDMDFTLGQINGVTKAWDTPCGEPAVTTVQLDGETYDACAPCASWLRTAQTAPATG